ncbi:hypothetical protein [uncultured Parabacteroides sp.]|uniref:hypothetical protein n=1 Tax=uncultured Parabacteroides sp. TaxID=512312 RepID=UPI0025D52BF2|nr:hypothetical protein [uncultured Parabacteroides sp.]
MRTLKFKIIGVSPLLMHDDKTANPFNEYSKQLKAISSKRKKSDDDLLEMARIEWMAGLYYTKEQGYFIKAECFEGTFLAAAKAKKLGKPFKESVSIPDNPSLEFKHKKLVPDQLFELDEYKDFRTVKIMSSKVIRCRPIFNQWSCEIEIWFDETRLNEEEVIQIVEYGARYIGVCDYRPKYGRFTVERID